MLIGFAHGCIVMYLLGVILHVSMLESTDPDEPNNPIKFALVWPIAALSVIYDNLLDLIRGREDNE